MLTFELSPDYIIGFINPYNTYGNPKIHQNMTTSKLLVFVKKIST